MAHMVMIFFDTSWTASGIPPNATVRSTKEGYFLSLEITSSLASQKLALAYSSPTYSSIAGSISYLL